MKYSQRRLKVVVAFNKPQDSTNSEDVDYLSETAVQEEANAVYQSLTATGHEARSLAVENLTEDLSVIEQFAPEVLFNLCEGFRGNARHEMHIAGLWELLGIPYTGNSAFTLGLAQDKVLSKKLFESKKIPTPPYQVYRETPQDTYLTYPLIAKPAREDASLGITQESVIHNLEELQQVVNRLLQRYRQPILVEKYIPGREFNISILGNHPPRVLAISEIDFSELEDGYHPITSYEAKWLSDHPVYHRTPAIVPAKVETRLARRLEDVALRVYELLSGRDYGRVDLRVDEQGRIFVLEYNPNPDISPGVGFARALEVAGIRYDDFVNFLLQEALKRKNV